MSAYQVLPDLDPDDYNALRADIEAHGIRVPVDVDEHGDILDGHHRSLIAHSLGITCPQRVLPGLTEAEKVAHALAVNVHRRTLSREQKRDLLAASIKAEPAASDAEHARRTGTSDKTAAAVRRDLEAGSEIPSLSERRGKDGKAYPASQPSRPQTSPASASAAGQMATAPGPDPIGAGEPDVGHLPIEEHPDYQDALPTVAQTADDDLAARMAETDARYLSNLFRAVTAVNGGLLALDPQRAVDTCRDLPDERDALLAFLGRVQTWSDHVRGALRPTHLRSVR